MGQHMSKAQPSLAENEEAAREKADSVADSQIETSDVCVSGLLEREAEFDRVAADQFKQPPNAAIGQGSQQQEIQCNLKPESATQMLSLPTSTDNLRPQQSRILSHRTQMNDSYAGLQELYEKLLSGYLPGEEPKLIKLAERRRTLILWFKQRPDSASQIERDKRLSSDGYEVYSTQQMSALFARYEQNAQHLQVWVLLSYSENLISEQAVKQLSQYFLGGRRVEKMLLVRPPEGPRLQHYKLHMSKVEANQHITSLSYQIELIRQQLVSEQNKVENGCNFLPLQYWHDRTHLIELMSQKQHAAFCIKTKINLQGFLRIGRSIVQNMAQHKQTFKSLLYHYAAFQDSYSDAPSLSQREYMEKFGLLMIEDPVKFYLQSRHSKMLDRMLRLGGDRVQRISVALLPLVLLHDRVQQEYYSEGQKRSYKNEFKCYYDLQLRPFELDVFQPEKVVQNLAFIKASLQPHSTHLNVHIVINVLGHSTCAECDNGYCFISESQAGEKYFSGYSGVLFNLMNSFRVVERRYDSRQSKHIIQLQYGYIARQIELKAMEDYIPTESQQLHYRPPPKHTPDIPTIIKYQSNLDITQTIADFGDCFSLLGEYNQAVAYYQELFDRNRADMKSNPVALAQMFEKKAENYKLRHNLGLALDNYYKAFNQIHKGAITHELEHIYLKTIEFMRGDRQHAKLVSFCENVIKNANTQSNWECYSLGFRLQLHQELALAYFCMISADYHCLANDSRISHHWHKGLQLIMEMGQYDKQAANFYCQLGRYHLVLREPVQGLAYLNKSLLILKAILTEQHPLLGPLHEYLSVGYFESHDYSKASGHLKQALAIYSRYYSEGDRRVLVCLELQACISKHLAQHEAAIRFWRGEVQLLRKVYKKEGSLVDEGELVRSDAVGICRNFDYKEKESEEKPGLKTIKNVLSISYCYAQIAQAYFCLCDFSMAGEAVQQGINACEWQLAAENVYFIQLHLLGTSFLLHQPQLQQFCDSMKKLWQLIEKKRLEKQQPAIKYHLLAASAAQPQSALNSVLKAREVAARCYGRSLEYCRITDEAGRYALKAGKAVNAANYFNQSQEIRSILMTEIMLSRHSISLYGHDLEDYQVRVKLHLCYCVENAAAVLLATAQVGPAVEKYVSCLNSAQEVVGQFHSYTAHVQKELGRVYLTASPNVTEAAKCYGYALSVFQNTSDHLELAETYEGLAAVREALNNLGQAIELWGKVITLARRHGMPSAYLQKAVFQFKRVAELILQHGNQSYLKLCYYVLADVFQQDKRLQESGAQLKWSCAGEAVKAIMAMSARLREKIELQELEGQCQEDIAKGGRGLGAWEEIKFKMQQRKMRKKVITAG